MIEPDYKRATNAAYELLLDYHSATDINTTEGKKAIADIMISKVYVYDDKLTVIFKDKDGKCVDIPLSAVSDSSSADCAPSALGSQNKNIQTVSIICGCMVIKKRRE